MSEANSYDAKARAEARRRRILEASQTRMNVVSGLPTDTNTSANTATGANTATNSDNDQRDQVNGKEEVSAAQKMAQMRRRRYGKKSDQSQEKQGTEEEAVKQVHLQENDNDETVPQKAQESKEREEEEEEKEKSKEAKETEEQEEESKQSKKYLGVAKMRRMKLAEKKAAEEAAFSSSTTTASSSTVISPEMKAKILASKQSAKTLPALLQLATVILLFLSGLDVGIQNHVVVKQNVPYLHENLSYQDHGIGAFDKLTRRKNEKAVIQENTIIHPGGGVNEDLQSEDTEFEDYDEYSHDSTKPAGASTSSKVSNIDPVFGVDFDALTAGTGLFYTFARFAVSVHRTLYHLFYTMPISILQSILSIPTKMFTHPPIMFLCAILIRFLGKHVLGGNIPDVKEMVEADENIDKAHATSTGTGAAAENKMGGAVDKLASTNFMAMGGNYVKNYMKDNFPKATLAFTLFKDARADMLVVLCGFFVGLVLPVGVGVIGTKSNSDEL